MIDEGTLYDSRTGTPARDRIFWSSLILIVVFGAWLRLYRLADYPQYFNQDESVLGYDAWSLWQTGHDQHGDVLPVFFRTFGDYVPPAANYLTAPVVGLLGLNEFATRLPAAVMGIATIFLVAITGRRWFGPLAGIAAALFLAVEPWHVNYSRIAFPASNLPFFTILALYAFTRACAVIKERAPENSVGRAALGWLALSGIAFGILTATHPVMKLQGPLLVAACLASATVLWKRPWLAAFWLFCYAFVINPLIIMQVLQWNLVQQRFNTLSGLERPNWIAQVIQHYVNHYDPLTLFVKGMAGGISVRPPGVGELFWLEGLLWFAAFFRLIQRRLSRRLGFNLLLVIAVWFFTFPVGDTLTQGEGATATQLGQVEEVRSYPFVPLPELLAGLGVAVIWEKLSHYRWGRLRANYLVLAAGSAVWFVFSFYFLANFFGPPILDSPTPVSEMAYNIGLRPMLDRVSQEASPCDVIWLQGTNQTYMYYLFLTAYPPAQFQKFAGQHIGYGKDSFITAIGQVHFGSPGLRQPSQTTPSPCPGSAYRIFYLARYPHDLPQWTLLDSYRNRAGVIIWGLYQTQQVNPAQAETF